MPKDIINKKALYTEWARLVVFEMQLRISDFTGELSKSLNFKVTDNAVEFYGAPYGIYVEMGSAPHWTSVNNLKAWCKAKWGDEKFAYALQHHIAKFGCFFGNWHNKIITNKGYKLLKDIKIGDKVLTHKNRLKKVIEKPIYNIGYKIPRYTIESETGNKVTVTEEHPFYCKRNEKFKWIKAKDLNENDIIQEVI